MIVVRYCCCEKTRATTVATMVWCEKHHWALFVNIHDKVLPIMTTVLYQVFSPYEEVEKISKFQTMENSHARVNLYSHKDVVSAFCKLEGH